MKNVAIDTDVIVASEIDNEKNHLESKKFRDYVLDSNAEELSFFTSIFTFLELASAMNRRTKDNDKAYSLVYRITRSWKDKINPLPLSSYKKSMTPNSFSKKWIDDLIETSIKFNSKSADTIQIQTILENQIDCFITWNKKDFLRLEKEIEGFKIFNPTEFLEEINKIEDIEIEDSDFIEFIASNSGLSIIEVQKLVFEKMKELSGIVSQNGAIQIIASDLGVKIK